MNKVDSFDEIYSDGSYLASNPTWHEEDSPWKASQIQKMLDRNSLTPKTICEIGCGVGEILNTLSINNENTSFFGYEISSQAFELSKKKTKPNLTFKLADLLEEDSAYFDMVMAIDVIEHVEDYFGFLRKMQDKGEYKIFHIPLDLSLQRVFRASKLTELRRGLGHIQYFTKETALETLKDTGYEIVDHFYTPGALELPVKYWTQHVWKLPRKLAFKMNEDLAVRVLGGYSLLVLTK